jgi:alkylation response protein AidB-like acyl-CoA dehydrogenase
MPLLSDDLLARVHVRAPGYDRDNAFFTDDLAELTAAGYLAALVPTEFGGAGLSLRDVVREQARLASAAPATALAIGMHLIWTGVAKALHARGDTSLDFVLRDAAAGELFAFAISEAGNDLVLFASATDAAPQLDGGYAFTGTKVFTSLSPAWTRLGTFGLDTTSPDAPKLVHAVITRDSPGITVHDDWNTLGMRATQSRTTTLDGATAEAQRVYRRLDPGPSADPLILAIFTNFEILIAAVYAGIGDRALELAVQATSRVSRSTGVATSQDPVTRMRIARAAMTQDAVWPRLEALADDVDNRVDHGDQWFRKAAGLKLAATQAARTVVDEAISVTGGASFASDSELGRLYRDVLAGGFHPSTADSTHSTVATALLGPITD